MYGAAVKKKANLPKTNSHQNLKPYQFPLRLVNLRRFLKKFSINPSLNG